MPRCRPRGRRRRARAGRSRSRAVRRARRGSGSRSSRVGQTAIGTARTRPGLNQNEIHFYFLSPSHPVPCADAREADLRALVQRVSQAAVDVEGERVAQIGPGLLVLLGVRRGDTAEDADRLADKVRALRIFDDAEGRMNEPLGEREVLCVSQFTLYGETRKGNRPSYLEAAPGPEAEPLYDRFCERLDAAKGVFGACMGVALVNDGPVTLMLET